MLILGVAIVVLVEAWWAIGRIGGAVLDQADMRS